MDNVEAQEVVRNERGEVGVPTAGKTIRGRWRASEKSYHKASLKKFARALLSQGDENAKEWFANKKGALNLKRNDKNVAAATAAGMASKAKKKK